MKKIIFSLNLILCLLFVACTKQDMTDSFQEIPVISNNENVDAFARILSVSLSNIDMRDYIITSALKEFDGDCNFLIAEKVAETNTKSYSTFYSLLKNSYLTKAYNNTFDLDLIISNIENYDPLLQIYIMNKELWTTGKTPIVVWLPEDFDERIPCVLTGYDINGKKLSIQSDRAITDRSVVVLSRNERVEVVQKNEVASNGYYLGAFPYYSNARYNYYLKEELSYPSKILARYSFNDFTKATTILTDQETAVAWGKEYEYCDRNIAYPMVEYIERVSIVDKDAWGRLESMWNGEPDLKVFIIRASKSLTSINIVVEKKHIGDGYGNRNNIIWKYVRLPLYLWSLANYGNTMKYEWFDEDGGKSVVANTKFTTQFYDYGSLPEQDVAMDVLKRDEYAGGSYVYYWQNWCQEYQTGNVKFEIQARK